MTDKLYVDTIEPEGATTNLAIGQSGQDIVVTGNDIRANVVQDAGGNAIFTSNGSGTLSGLSPDLRTKALISTQTASAQASISFTSGLSSSYEHYIFEFRYMLPASNLVNFLFQVSTNAGVAYGIEITSSVFQEEYKEDGTHTQLGWKTNDSLDDSTSYQTIYVESPNSAPSTFDGRLHLFNPASTTYKKNFWSELSGRNASDDPLAEGWFVGGYVNTTDEVDAINFKFASGNITSGQIRMYGVK